MQPGSKPRFQARQTRLLDAAERIFRRDGMRGATMSAIALEAGVAKATAYAYLADKEQAFQAVAERVAARLVRAVDDAFAAAHDPAHGLVAALVAKELLAFETAHGSPHARELLQSRDVLAKTAFAAADARIEARFGEALARLGVAAPEQAARIMLAGGIGLAQAATGREALAADLSRFTDALLTGLRPTLT